jgi:Ca-activated chloride channel family protein
MLRSRSISALGTLTLTLAAASLAGCGAGEPSAKSASDHEYVTAGATAPMQPEFESSADSAAAPKPAEARAMAPMQRAATGAPVTPGAIAPAAPPPPSKMAAPAATSLAGQPPEPQGTEAYKDYGINPATDPAKDRFSTFAIDVDTASYAIARRKILEGTLPPYQAVRAEEFLNYFGYAYAAPKSGPFTVHLAAAPSPYTKGHHFLRVGVQGKRVEAKERTPVHLVYLVDTSGSMQSADKMGLVKKSLRILTDGLKTGDTVALCTYAGSVREVLAPTGIDNKGRIHAAIEDLTASGSTAMSSGIELAYKLAERTLVKGHVNRVVVLSDGDANVGATSHDEILKTIRLAKGKGITLSTVGFGNGNYKDTMMEQLADNGDGNYSYIDSESQARRVFSEQLSGLLQVIARDVKIQVEFDPNVVKEYRLIGYENRDVADKDFRNDKVDGGEIGAGHSVTALYDVVLKSTVAAPVTVRLRHKEPIGGEKASEVSFRLDPSAIAASFEAAPADLRFATAVAGFAEILRRSPHAKEWKMGDVERIARAAAADRGDQQEFLDIVRRAGALAGGAPVPGANVAR